MVQMGNIISITMTIYWKKERIINLPCCMAYFLGVKLLKMKDLAFHAPT